MAIDLEALRLASDGDPGARVTVNRRWLVEVHRTLVAQQREIAGLKANTTIGDHLADIGERLAAATGWPPR